MKIIYHGFIYESAGGKTLISVDIQPEYESAFGFKIYNFVNWLKRVADQFDRIIFLFNGPDLGFHSEEEYKYWLFDNGISEDLLNRIHFFEKGYAFFRNAIDAGLDENEIVKLIQYMVRNNINDSRDIDEDAWQDIGVDDALISQMKGSEDALFIPEVLSFLNKVNGHIDLVGGGVNECLKEVELCLRALNKPFNLIDDWTY